MVSLKDSLKYFGYDINVHFQESNGIHYEDLKDFFGWGIYTEEELRSPKYKENNGVYLFTKKQIKEFFKRTEEFIKNNEKKIKSNENNYE